jgi:hypothetical protein
MHRTLHNPLQVLQLLPAAQDMVGGFCNARLKGCKARLQGNEDAKSTLKERSLRILTRVG